MFTPKLYTQGVFYLWIFSFCVSPSSFEGLTSVYLGGQVWVDKSFQHFFIGEHFSISVIAKDSCACCSVLAWLVFAFFCLVTFIAEKVSSRSLLPDSFCREACHQVNGDVGVSCSFCLFVFVFFCSFGNPLCTLNFVELGSTES